MKYFLIVILLALASCKKGHETDCFKGTGDITTVSYPLSESFNRVEANGRIRINFIQDSLNTIDITCGAKLLDGVFFEVRNSTLFLDDHTRCHWVRNLHHVPVITIHYTTLNYLKSDNFGDNRFLTPHKGDTMLIEYWTGSGVTYYSGYTEEAYFKVNAGSGAFVTSGSSKLLYVYHSGGSLCNFSEFHAPNTYVNNRSNNDVLVFSDSLLHCDIARSGNVLYKGNPVQIIRTGLGTGQILPQ